MVAEAAFCKACKYFYMAAAGGLPDACYNLGVIAARKDKTDAQATQIALNLFSKGIIQLYHSSSSASPRCTGTTDFDQDFATTLLWKSLIEMQGAMLLRGSGTRCDGIVSHYSIECALCGVPNAVLLPCQCSPSQTVYPSETDIGPKSTCGLYFCSDSCRRGLLGVCGHSQTGETPEEKEGIEENEKQKEIEEKEQSETNDLKEHDDLKDLKEQTGPKEKVGANIRVVRESDLEQVVNTWLVKIGLASYSNL